MNISQNMPGAGAPGRAYRPIYKRVRFWFLVLVLLVLAVYLRGYFTWQGEQGKYDIRNVVSQNYWNYLQKQSADLEKQYREDTYGGATPEETLKLFVQALEKKDYVLASKYFIPEKQAEYLRRMPEGVRSGGLDAFSKAYRNGKVTSRVVGNESEIQMLGIGEEAPYLIRLVRNQFTNKWKISEI